MMLTENTSIIEWTGCTSEKLHLDLPGKNKKEEGGLCL
jgi:hypothetical protein